jgi:hypothetical protein
MVMMFMGVVWYGSDMLACNLDEVDMKRCG